MTTSRTQSLVISNLALGETRPTNIARKIGITPQAMSHVIADMTKMGLVQRAADRNDGRARVIDLTKSGKKYHSEVRSILFEMEALLERRFGRPLIDVVRMVVEADWGAAPNIDEAEHTQRRGG